MGCEEIREAPFIADRGYSNIVRRFVSMRFIAKCSRAFVCADHGTKNFFVPCLMVFVNLSKILLGKSPIFRLA